ncbi:MAG: aspartate aminotransferase family protein [Alphaproteobacteria bacterium]|jgi:4-aminobutyrate--pyruvate transaminase|nr:aspartate aminotransferase family protein [Beijerinckiaceae bacterium]NBQ38455.1 aspartate aminotransferase family protein [Alphaproteobacteria bacterium]
MTALPNSLAARDIEYYFHPVTNARRHEQVGPMIISKGKGVYVYDDMGKEYIEAMAGLWSVAVGFGEDRLVQAATRQMSELPFYHSFSHKSHPTAIALAERMVKMSPGNMGKAHFVNSGSEANDTVVKMIWFYNNARGKPEKKKIISRIKAYHGITMMSASLTGLPNNHRDFDLPFPQIKHVSCPHHYRFAEADESEEDFATRLAKEFEDKILAEGPETVAAFIGEPVMGAGGVFIPPRTYWTKMQEVCRKYDILIVVDEVINGFGRTGNVWGSDTYGIKPDFMICSKQITSSYVPLASITFTNEIYNVIADNTAKIGTFAHGFTTSGHPLAMAVAMENLDIIEERNLMGRVNELSPHFLQRLHSFKDHPLVGETRGVGLIGAIELVADKKTKAGFEKPGATGLKLAELGHEEGVIFRPIGDILAFCPPLIITDKQIDDIFDGFGRALDRLTV